MTQSRPRHWVLPSEVRLRIVSPAARGHWDLDLGHFLSCAYRCRTIFRDCPCRPTCSLQKYVPDPRTLPRLSWPSQVIVFGPHACVPSTKVLTSCPSALYIRSTTRAVRVRSYRIAGKAWVGFGWTRNARMTG